MAPGKDIHPPAWSRYFRRLFRPFLDANERARIAAAVAEAESRTICEIVVHIEGRAGPGDILEIARSRFFELGLDKTKERNAVLILVSDLDHRFAIWGDEGIHAKAGQELWDKARETLLTHFAMRCYADGLECCVREVGIALAQHFPKGPEQDANELPDAPTES